LTAWRAPVAPALLMNAELMNAESDLTLTPEKIRSTCSLAIAAFQQFLMIALTGAVMTGSVHSAPVETENVASQLISEVVEFTPGQTIWIGLHQVVRPHWHTYWKNPGDSGEPTQIDWELPNGFSAGQIRWPVPKRIDLAHLTNFGFEGEYVLLTELRTPADIEPGTTVTLTAAASWLVCEEICIPENAELDLVLTATSDRPAADPIWAELIAQGLADLPRNVEWKAVVGFIGDQLVLALDDRDLRARIEQAEVDNAFFYPAQDGLIDNAAAQTLHLGREGISLALTRGFNISDPQDLRRWTRIEGVLVLNDKPPEVPEQASAAPRQGYAITASVGEPDTALWGPAAAPGGISDLSLVQAVFFGLLGGILLNIMPCVFPVLSMKALSFAQKAGKDLNAVRAGGLAYTAGVVVSFMVLATVLFSLKAAGEQVGLGFQLQSPTFVAILAYLMFLIGLNLAGVFQIGGLANLGAGAAAGSGIGGSFFTGVLAVVVATPCTAPFMASALGFTLLQPFAIGVLVFISLGLGLALPYLLLSFSPGLIRLLPRPGPWMETFRQVLAFPMFATAAWLVWVLSAQIGQIGLGQVLAGFVIVAFAAWILQRAQMANLPRTRRLGSLGALGFVAAAAFLAFGAARDEPAARDVAAVPSAAAIAYETYSPARLDSLRTQGKPVFLNFTADWCITCKFNEGVALNKARVVSKLNEYGVVALKGDWTSRDETISKTLESFGRTGVPLYVLYPRGADSDPVILPQFLSEQMVLSHLESHLAK